MTDVESDSYKISIHVIQGFIYQNVIKYVAIHCVKDVGTAHTQDTRQLISIKYKNLFIIIVQYVRHNQPTQKFKTITSI